MLLGCIADDFTGASDLANTLARQDMRTVQFSGVPEGNEVPDCEAAVVALKTRSIERRDAVEQSLAALKWLRGEGCRQFLFKYCSTFDSTPKGNIGPVAEALLQALDVPCAIVCPVFPATGRTLYMGHLFVGDRLLSESGMQSHPLNPMTDPDIRRWLQRQTAVEVGLVAYGAVREGSDSIRAAIAAETHKGRRLIVVDALADCDLMAIGRAIADHVLISGGSGIALGLPDNFRSLGLLRDAGSDFTPTRGKAAVISGSCSRTSIAQVNLYLQSHPGLAVDGGDILEGRLTPQAAIAFFDDHSNEAPLIYSTAEPDKVKATQEKYGREEVAQAIERFLAEVAVGLIDEGVVRLAVGGGETSGAVVTALAVPHMLVGPEIDPGVPALAASGARPVRLALKSGNFGTENFYEKALRMLGTA
ncbi:four-carbon acid sugar kinase family protein [Mesorhizobium sp. CU2]|uniref:3-oxo-tetronate kinase n=1 Tax=unclassified Mesorhizobium TaxID=325217 RepID=UPI00112C7598|nr:MULTISPECIES: 3-oxo-tetronate kinase [unclassified Mesorhizobium]TPN81053.1 four-carbon acid sugar kinase family protein [Mesorhizobium sp. CU3]TPO09808.1 four-carbon acid sugar kinase family protein [Mesorhizobium sp. CU2]